jgi:hypothetical protein
MSRPRRKLTTVDDPLEPARAPAAMAVAAPAGVTRRASQHDDGDVQALFVRVPAAHGDALARAAFELRLHKQEIVAALLARYVDPHTAEGLDVVRQLVEEYRGAKR